MAQWRRVLLSNEPARPTASPRGMVAAARPAALPGHAPAGPLALRRDEIAAVIPDRVWAGRRITVRSGEQTPPT